jgi:hypothetical protein
MPKPQAKNFEVIEIPIRKDEWDKHEWELIITVLFDEPQGVHFSLHARPEPEHERLIPIMEVNDHKRLHSELLNEVYVEPGAQFACLVHELGGPDHKPEGRVIIQLASHRGPLPNGHITIEIPRGQVALRYFELVEEDEDEKVSKPRSARRAKDEDGDEEEG